jgi:hypothetical protein
LGFSLNLPGSASPDAGGTSGGGGVTALGAGLVTLNAPIESNAGDVTLLLSTGDDIPLASCPDGTKGGYTGGGTPNVSLLPGSAATAPSGRVDSVRGLRLIFAGGGGALFVDSGGVASGLPVSAGDPDGGNGAAVDNNRGFRRRGEGGGVCSSLIWFHESNFHRERETKKFPSRSRDCGATFRPVFNMTKALLLFLSLATLAVSSGCLFSRKARRAKESTAISADVEESFRKRWVDKRAGELAAQGTSADAARTQADAEFRERYGFTRAGTQK